MAELFENILTVLEKDTNINVELFVFGYYKCNVFFWFDCSFEFCNNMNDNLIFVKSLLMLQIALTNKRFLVHFG